MANESLAQIYAHGVDLTIGGDTYKLAPPGPAELAECDAYYRKKKIKIAVGGMRAAGCDDREIRKMVAQLLGEPLDPGELEGALGMFEPDVLKAAQSESGMTDNEIADCQKAGDRDIQSYMFFLQLRRHQPDMTHQRAMEIMMNISADEAAVMKGALAGLSGNIGEDDVNPTATPSGTCELPG